MSLSIEYVSHRLFVGGYYGRIFSNHYFRCFFESCPFSVLLAVSIVSGASVASSTQKVVVPVHYHEKTERSKGEIKKEIMNQLKFICQHPDDPQAIIFQQQRDFWNNIARKYSKDMKNHLIIVEALKV